VANIQVVSEKKKFDGNVLRIAECVVGDAQGCLSLTAKDEQIDVVKEGQTITLMNAHCKVVSGFLKIELDKWAFVKQAAPANTVPQVNLANNFSEVEYELVKNEADEEKKDTEAEVKEGKNSTQTASAERGRGKNQTRGARSDNRNDRGRGSDVAHDSGSGRGQRANKNEH